MTINLENENDLNAKKVKILGFLAYSLAFCAIMSVVSIYYKIIIKEEMTRIEMSELRWIAKIVII